MALLLRDFTNSHGRRLAILHVDCQTPQNGMILWRKRISPPLGTKPPPIGRLKKRGETGCFEDQVHRYAETGHTKKPTKVGFA